MTHTKNTFILTHRDVDGVCAAAIAKASYPKAKVGFANPPDFVSMLDSLSGYDCVIILDLGIDSVQKDEAIASFRKLSTTSSIIYIDHHLRTQGLTERNLACKGVYRTDASTSELAWEFFKPSASRDFIAVLGAIGDYKERTPQIQGLIEKYDERKVYPEALFLEWALMVSEDRFNRRVIEELAQCKWPYQMSIMGKEADAIVRRQRTLERYVREKAEKICEHVMLIRDPPFKATGPAATLLTKLDNVDIGIASRTDENHVYLSLRRHEESAINLASLIDKSASKLGGMGGGHLAASGGKIPAERFDEFLVEIKRVLSKGRLKRINKLDVGSVDKKKIERKLFKEIIERRRAEERAERYREYLQLQVDRMPIGSIVWDGDFRVKTWNPAATKIFGFTEEEALGKHPYDFIVPKEAQPHVDAIWRRLLEGDLTAYSVNENTTKDGRIIICDWANTPLKEADGTVISVLSMVQDITERKRAEEALRRLATVVQDSNDAITVQDFDGNILGWNQGAVRMYGWSEPEAIEMNIVNIIPKGKRGEAVALVQKLRAGEAVEPFETQRVTRDGRTLNVWLTVTKLANDAGETVAIATTERDITKRRRAEEELVRLSNAVKMSADSIVISDLEGRITDVNEATLKMYGTDDKRDIIGKSSFDIIAPEDRKKAFAGMKELLESGYIRGREYRILIKDGSKILVEMDLALMKDANGNPTGFIAVSRNIIERKRAEEALRESERRFRDIAENAREWIWEVDAEGKYTFTGPIIEKILGYKPEEVLGLHFYDLFHPDDREKLKTAAFEAFAKKQPFRGFVNRNVHKGGKTVWLSTNGSPILDAKGNLLGYIGADIDITERIRAENKIKVERALYRSIARAANRSRTLEELCKLALSGIQKVIKYDMADVMVYNESENTLSAVAQVGFPKDLYGRTVKWLDLNYGSKVAAQAALKRKGIYIDDVKTSKLMSLIHDLIVKYDISTMYSVPLFNRSKLQGVLEVITVGDNVLSKEDREVLDTISEELAGGIAKAVSAEHLVTVREAFGWLSIPTSRTPPLDPHP
jgi:PAS domain S-box-containing protein